MNPKNPRNRSPQLAKTTESTEYKADPRFWAALCLVAELLEDKKSRAGAGLDDLLDSILEKGLLTARDTMEAVSLRLFINLGLTNPVSLRKFMRFLSKFDF